MTFNTSIALPLSGTILSEIQFIGVTIVLRLSLCIVLCRENKLIFFYLYIINISTLLEREVMVSDDRFYLNSISILYVFLSFNLGQALFSIKYSQIKEIN